MGLSKNALEVLKVIFNDSSNMQVPVSCIETIIEIRNWIKEQNGNG